MSGAWHTFCLSCVEHAGSSGLDWFVIHCEEPGEHDDLRRERCCGCGSKFEKDRK